MSVLLDQTQNARWFRILVDSFADAVIVSNAEGRVEFLNVAAVKVTGVSEADAIGQPLTSVLHLRTKNGCPLKTDLTRLATLSGSPTLLGSNLVLYGAHGETDVEGEAAPFTHLGTTRGVIITLRDVTRQRSEEAARHRSQTFQAMAQLAGSIAHDLNNALTLIMGYSEELLTCIPSDHPSRAVAEHIRDAGDIAAKVAAQLEILGRKQLLLPQVLNLNALIDESVDQLRSVIGAEIQIEREPASVHGEIHADPEQIRAMLTNFVLYGDQVLSQKGRITFRTSDEEVAPLERGARARKFLRLSVTYSGSAIRDEDLDNLFKPCWKTVDAFTAQGLELFVIGGIVSDASAHISVDKCPGVSMTFVVTFPCVEDPPPLISNEYAGAALVKPTILLVEDDDDIRALLSRFFGRQGYHLLEARDGEDAIMASELYQGLIDVVITDVVMPRMSGPQLVHLLAKNRPETKALLISGYPPEPGAVRDLIRQGVHFLQKPFRSEELLSRVHQVLIERQTKVN